MRALTGVERVDFITEGPSISATFSGCFIGIVSFRSSPDGRSSSVVLLHSPEEYTGGEGWGWKKEGIRTMKKVVIHLVIVINMK